MAPKFDVNHINPFLQSCISIVESVTQVKMTVGKPEKTDFEKDAANEMRANTVARKKGETVKPKGTLEERYTKACFYMMNNDGKPYKRSIIDSLNTLYDDLIEAGEKDKAEDLKVGIDRIVGLDDKLPE